VSVEETLLTQNIVTNTNTTITTAISNQIYVGMEVVASGIPVGAVITAIIASATPGDYSITISLAATASATVSAAFKSVPGLISLWQHEIGTNEVKGQNVRAIRSSFETNDLGLIAGGPSQPSMVGDNFWLHLERMEPDFIQSGEMTFQVTGCPFAQAEDTTSAPYAFSPDTRKIDLREQRRELRLIFRSNVQGGDYQLGKVLLHANVGDVRP
jgi:hypothetical protein